MFSQSESSNRLGQVDGAARAAGSAAAPEMEAIKSKQKPHRCFTHQPAECVAVRKTEDEVLFSPPSLRSSLN